MSYASVVTGTPTNQSSNPTRSGSLAQNATSHNANAYPPQYQADARTAGRDHDMASYSTSSSQRRGLSFSSHRQNQASTVPPFWVPPYLEESRYAKKLEAAYNARVRALREQDATSSIASSSIWNWSSNARIAPSHRGMTYDIIESIPPLEDDTIPLPTRLSSTDKHQGLDLLGEGLEVRYNGPTGKDLEAASIRSDHPISPQCGIYYYEINVRQKSKDCAVAIGFSTSDFSLERLPGWEPKSWAYHGDDGKAFEGQSSGHPYESGFGASDVVGCGIDFNKGHAFFTKNGRDLGVAFRDITFPSTPVFPCIGMKKHTGVLIKVNFGQQPFVFDVKDKMAEEQDNVARHIARTSTHKLHPRQPTEAAFTQELIAQFLSHSGYIETAQAFSQQVEKEQQALYGSEQPSHSDIRSPDTFDARPRQQIRQAILGGDIDAALDATEEHFPGVLEAHPQIFFQLKCRKFVELVLKAARIDKSRDTLRRNKHPGNGAASQPSAVDDVFESAMELDEEQQTSLNGHGKAPMQTNPESEEYNQLIAQTIEYGQSLKEEYGEKGNPEQDKILHDIFSLMPYYDPSPSQNGHLLDSSGRTKVSEDLNSAILTSLGRPSNAALETLYRQTESLLDVLSLEGGPASLVDLERQPGEASR
ncbi:hypothetical protein LTS08_007568 [Lithohypha guttulata]|nr:hypothetical protein LTS08_007568 [Lithohypha guttulata]